MRQLVGPRRGLFTPLRIIITFAVLALVAACGSPDPTPTPDPGNGAPQPTPTAEPPDPGTTPDPDPDLDERAEEYFRGKTIRLIVGFSPGGGHDVVARVLGGILGEYIPGDPRIIVQNMEGGGSSTAAEHVFRATPDGLTWAVTANQMVDGALGKRFAHFDALQSPVMGIVYDNISNRPFTGVWNDVGETFEEILQTRTHDNPVTLGALRDVHSGLWSYFMEAYDLPFRTVPGYGGTSQVLQAMANREVDGTEVFFSSTILGLGIDTLATSENIALILDPYCAFWPRLEDWLEHGGWERPPCWEDVLPITDNERLVLELGEDIEAMSTYVIHGAPGVEDWVLQVLRNALREVSEDPRFQQEMVDRDAFPGYISGEDVEELNQRIVDAPAEVLQILREARGVFD